MSITIEWDNNEKTIIRYTFMKGWQLSEVEGALKQGGEMIATVGHIVDVIMDFHAAPLFAPSGTLSFATRIMKNSAPPNAGTTAIVGSRFMINMLNIVQGIVRDIEWQSMGVRDLTEAREKLKLKREKRKQLS